MTKFHLTKKHLKQISDDISIWENSTDAFPIYIRSEESDEEGVEIAISIEELQGILEHVAEYQLLKLLDK